MNTKSILLSAALICAAPCAFADYYRSAGGGLYELYVNDCSRAGMRRALDAAVADKKAVITKVRCAAQPVAPAPVYVDTVVDWSSVPLVDLCPCSIECGCGC